MAQATCSLAVAMALILALSTAQATRPVGLRRLQQGEPLEPTGMWQSVQAVTGGAAGGPWCGLRDFPPIPDGYGTSRMLCGGSEASVYDIYWKWSMSKPNSGQTTFPTTILTGEPFNLRMFPPMLTYCFITSAAQVKCGAAFSNSSSYLFTVEKVGSPAAGQVVDFNQDQLYLKSGGKYCKISGSANSAFVYCNVATAAGATIFRMPFSSLTPVVIESAVSSTSCGAQFIPTGRANIVMCNISYPAPFNTYTNFVASAQTPGVSGLVNGGAYAFSTYDELWHYQFAAWGVLPNTSTVVSLNNGDARPVPQGTATATTTFFQLWNTNTTSPAGTPFENGDIVNIKSLVTGKWCHASPSAPSLLCDESALSTTNGYDQFAIFL